MFLVLLFIIDLRSNLSEKKSQWLLNNDASIFLNKVLLKNDSSICVTSLTWKRKLLMKHYSVLNQSFKRALSWLLKNEMNKILMHQNDEKTWRVIKKWFDLIWIHTFLWHWFKFNSWEKLCYVYWMNKTLWERKSLVNYTTTLHHWNNKTDTVLSIMNL